MEPGLEALVAEAELGEAARAFLESDLGKCLIGMAQQEVATAEKELGKVDPRNEKRIVELQRIVWNGEHFEQWLMELLHKGEQAIAIYRQNTRE